MFGEDSELISQVYPWATHRWVMTSPDGARPERYVCSRCRATKVVWNDVSLAVYDADGNDATEARCEFYGVAKVMES